MQSFTLAYNCPSPKCCQLTYLNSSNKNLLLGRLLNKGGRFSMDRQIVIRF